MCNELSRKTALNLFYGLPPKKVQLEPLNHSRRQLQVWFVWTCVQWRITHKANKAETLVVVVAHVNLSAHVAAA